MSAAAAGDFASETFERENSAGEELEELRDTAMSPARFAWLWCVLENSFASFLFTFLCWCFMRIVLLSWLFPFFTFVVGREATDETAPPPPFRSCPSNRCSIVIACFLTDFGEAIVLSRRLSRRQVSARTH